MTRPAVASRCTHPRRRTRSSLAGAAALGLALLAGCGDDGPVEPNIPREQLAGSYTLAELSFDPQGSLPAVDVRARLQARNKPDASLTLLEDGRLQLLFEDPGSSLLRLVEGTYRTTPDGAFLDLGGITTYEALLLPRRATYALRTDGALVVGDTSSVRRGALVELVTEWAQEPLLDPVPGLLTAAFVPTP